MGRTHDAPRCAVLAGREHLHQLARERRPWLAQPARAAVLLERAQVRRDRPGEPGASGESPDSQASREVTGRARVNLVNLSPAASRLEMAQHLEPRVGIGPR